MPYKSIADAKAGKFPTTAEGITLSLAQINKLASIYDAISEAGTVDNPMAVAWTTWKKVYKKDGDKWVKREKENVSSMISTKPTIKDNKITIPFVKNGTIGFANDGKKYIITSEALKNDHKTWENGIVTVNHRVKEQGVISKTWYDDLFAYAEITGLSDEAISIVNSPAYRGVSQESIATKVDEKGNVSSLKGTGITLVIYPETPACSLTAGCGTLMSSTLLHDGSVYDYFYSTDTISNYNINTSNENKRTTNSIRRTDTMTTDDGALEALNKEFEALKIKSTALESDIETKSTKVAELEKLVSTKDKEIMDLKSTIEKANNDLPTLIKSALEAHDAAVKAQIEYTAAVTELKSVMKEPEDFLKTEPTTAQIMSMVKALKAVIPGDVGASHGADIKSQDMSISDQIQSIGYPSIEFMGA